MSAVVHRKKLTSSRSSVHQLSRVSVSRVEACRRARNFTVRAPTTLPSWTRGPRTDESPVTSHGSSVSVQSTTSGLPMPTPTVWMWIGSAWVFIN